MTRITAAALLALLPTSLLAQEGGIEGGGGVDTRDDAYLQSVADMKITNTAGEEIAEIEEILVDAEGRPAGFRIEIAGGLLDFGDDDVFVPLESLEWDGSGYVSRMSAEQLANLRPFDM